MCSSQSESKSSLYEFADSYLETTEPDKVKISYSFDKRMSGSNKIDANNYLNLEIIRK